MKTANTYRENIVTIEIPGLTNKQIDNRIKKLEALEAEKKALEARIEQLKDEVKAEMQDTEMIETAHYKINFTTVTATRFDSKELKAADPETYNLYTKESTTRRFTYKAIA